ncbi:hypothetical protein IFM89_005709 [Coptis chinensis]|uniref:ABC transporter domain-containing protein n=1 Tax=Coptis chinensis TaxID=261450 RepID=A0A835IC50_9MAGN|nr:hypothetical protein IFM89_005709 [Coptis chinensis]
MTVVATSTSWPIGSNVGFQSKGHGIKSLVGKVFITSFNTWGDAQALRKGQSLWDYCLCGTDVLDSKCEDIQLARAVYQDCDIHFLDDVFSAVDAHTGSDIFKECVRGPLKNKTILLVTHQVDFLHNVDIILVMRDGMIVQFGKYNELLDFGTDFGALVAAHETSMELVEQMMLMNHKNYQNHRATMSMMLFLSHLWKKL